MFSSLKVREFRIFWVSMFLSLIGTWVQSVAQSWLVFSLTHSAFLLGVVGFLGTLPVALFSAPAGVFVDRAVKRDLLLLTQALLMGLAFVMALLVQSGQVRVWQIMAIAILNGLVFAVDAPARQSMVVELVGKQHLFNAIALNSAAFNSARLIGPAIAGVLIGVSGMAVCFFINAASFLPLLTALFFIRARPAAVNGRWDSWRKDMGCAIAYLRTKPLLLALLGLVAMYSMFGAAYIVLMPVFVEEVLHSGPKGLALLMSANGAGALAGVLNLARLTHTAPKERILKVCIALFLVSLMVFSLSRSLALSASMLFACGFGGATSVSLINVLLQTNIPDEYRGRIMGVYVMMFTGLMPIGNLFSGILTHFFSAPPVIFFGTFVSFLAYIFLAKRYLGKGFASVSL